MFALSIDKDTGRILHATYPKYAPAGAVIVDALPEGDIYDYRYADGKYIYDPLPEPVQPEEEASADDVLNVLLGVTE